MPMPYGEYYKTLGKDNDRFLEFIQDNIQFCDDHRLREVFETVWIQKFNRLCKFSYANDDGKVFGVIINVASRQDLTCYSPHDYKLNLNESVESELQKLTEYICERFGTIKFFREWIRFGDGFKDFEINEQKKRLEGIRRASCDVILNFVQWLTNGELSENYSASNTEMGELGLSYNRSKFRVESGGITIESWDNGKLRFSGLTEPMIARYKTLEQSNKTHWKY